MTSFRRDFNKALRNAKTPRQAYLVYKRFADDQLAKYGVIALSYFDEYINSVGAVLKNDVQRKRFSHCGRKPHVITKKSAAQLADLLEKFGNRLTNKLERLEKLK